MFLWAVMACVEHEGDDAGECLDGADNDQDGYFDCDDAGCWGSPDCVEDTGSPTDTQDSSPPEDTSVPTDDTEDSSPTDDTSVPVDDTDDETGWEDPNDKDGDGWSVDDDCDDLNAAVHPYSIDLPDGVDNDCDGQTDEEHVLPGASWWAFGGDDPDRDECGTWVHGWDQGIAIVCERAAEVIVFESLTLGTFSPADADQVITGSRIHGAATSGDFDGDGDTELWVTQAYASATYDYAGRSALINRSDGNIDTLDASVSIIGTITEADLGHTMGAVGDVDGDGDDDLIVTESAGSTKRGYLLMDPFSGKDNLAGDVAEARFDYAGNSGWPSFVVAENQGDLDGDGTADILLAHPWDGYGHVFVVGDSPEATVDLDDAADATWRGYGGRLGTSLAWIGDWDGDGLDDFAVGTPYANSSGRVFIITDSSGGILADASTLNVHGGQGFDYVGTSVTGADLNGDGVRELIQGGVGPNGGYTVHTGPLSGSQWAGDGLWITENESDPSIESFIGSSIATVDADGDGHEDVALTAWQMGTVTQEDVELGGRVWLLGDGVAP